MLTAGDEYPIHQTPEPVAFAGSDRNFYDRFFFNGYNQDGSLFFAAAMGIYPHLNILDAAVSVLREGRQSSLFFSRPLNMERMDTRAGPFSVSVTEPLRRIRLNLAETEGLGLDLEFTGRAGPIEEPRFTRRLGPRLLMDLTRMTQNGRWSGALRIDGKEIVISPEDCTGTRDRSWGIRPVGAPDAQPLIPPLPPQFYWIWTPLNFPNASVFYHVNQDGEGAPWNTRAVMMPDGAAQGEGLHLDAPEIAVRYAPGTRRMAWAELGVRDPSGREHKVSYEASGTFLMKGLGYGHPVWRHGGHHGDTLAMAREDFEPAKLPWQVPENLHIQEIVRVRHEGPDGLSSQGIGAFEQLFLGPHAPSGFKDILDGAA